MFGFIETIAKVSVGRVDVGGGGSAGCVYRSPAAGVLKERQQQPLGSHASAKSWRTQSALPGTGVRRSQGR